MFSLKNKLCLVTAGPTYEPIDPVRFIGNRSSGKMGIAIAKELQDRGAKVILIIGATAEAIPANLYKTIKVETADEMYRAVMAEIEQIEVGIFAAAVADYTPKIVAKEKIKKAGEELLLTLVKTKDILKEVGLTKKDTQIIVGFALETNNEQENALQKLQKKNLDFIVLNSLKNEGAGFQHTTNQISILDKYNNTRNFELKSKTEVAEDIVNYLVEYCIKK